MNSNKTKVVITGASGFLGRNLIAYLDENDKYFIYALSSQSKVLQEKNRYKNVMYYDKNAIFTDQDKLILENAILVNCAFPRNSTGTGMADGLKYIQGVFLKAKECKAKAVINISSQSVYSAKRETAATEETPVCLENTYAVGKYATELMLESLLQGTDIYFTNIRLASLIGPGFDQRIVNRFVKHALNEHALKVKKNRQLFGFLDVKDAVVALGKVVDKDCSTWKTTYNLGIILAYTLVDIACAVKEVIQETTGMEILLEFSTGDEKCNSELDARDFYRDFSFFPEIKLKQSILQIYEENVLV